MTSKMCIITVAPTGGVTSGEQQPNLPEQPVDIIREVLKCEKEGASLAHLHTRDDNGKHTLDVAKFRDILNGIRKESGIITCVSTTNWNVTNSTMENKFKLVSLKPDFFSFHVNSFNRGEKIFVNDPGAVKELLGEAKILDVKPEFEVFDLGAIYKAKELIEEFGLGKGQRFQFMFGVPGGVRDINSQILKAFVEAVGPDHHWGVGAVGRFQLKANLLSLMEGGDVRTGFEDNIYFRKGELAQSNAQFVNRLIMHASDLNIPVANINDARLKLGRVQQLV